MGLLDKMRGALNAVTGGAAQVTLEFEPPARLGQEFRVRVTAASSGAEVKSQGAFVDVVASERVAIKGAPPAPASGNPMGASLGAASGLPPLGVPAPAPLAADKSGRPTPAAGAQNSPPPVADVNVSHVTFQHGFPIAGPLTLAAGETRQFEGAISLPVAAQPSYAGQHAHHEWHIRGRLEAWGNDPDSGFQPLRVVSA